MRFALFRLKEEMVNLSNGRSYANDNANRKAFGDKIRTQRRSQGLNMNDLAARAKISGDLLLRIESGLVSPDIPSIQKRLKYALEREVMVIA